MRNQIDNKLGEIRHKKISDRLLGKKDRLEDVEGEDAHDGAGGEGDDPREDDIADHVEVNGAHTARKTDAEDGADEAVSGRDGHAELGGDENGGRGSKFCTKTASGGELGDFFADGFNDAPAPCGKSDHDADTAEGQKPGGDGSRAGDNALLDGVEDSRDGTNGIGNVVSSVGKGDKAGAHDLEVDEHFFYGAVLRGPLGETGLLAHFAGEGLHFIENFPYLSMGAFKRSDVNALQVLDGFFKAHNRLGKVARRGEGIHFGECDPAHEKVGDATA